MKRPWTAEDFAEQSASDCFKIHRDPCTGESLWSITRQGWEAIREAREELAKERKVKNAAL